MKTYDVSAFVFFRDNAGFCQHANETEKHARQRCARALARAERWLSQQNGHTVEWSEDDYPDRSGIDHSGPLYCCAVEVPGIGRESLCGIDLGENASLSEPYTRVVVAELASELFARK